MAVPPLVELDAPSSAPASTPNDVAWAGTAGDYLAVAQGAGIKVYKRVGDTLASPLTVPSNPAAGIVAVDWSPDGAYLFAAEGVGQVIHRWSRSGDTLTFLGTTASAGQTLRNMRISPSSTHLVTVQTGSSGAKQVRLHSHDGAGGLTFLQQISIESGLETAFGVAWSPNSDYMVIGLGGSSNGAYLVKRVGNAISLVNTQAIAGNIAATMGLAWYDNNTLVVTARAGSANVLKVYTRTGDTLSAGTDNAAITSGTITGTAAIRTQDGSTAASWNNALHLLERAGEALTDTPATYAQSSALRWTPDGAYLAGSITGNVRWWKVGEVAVIPPLRQRQRNDGAGANGPRQRVGNQPTSKQAGVRQGWANTYL